MYLTEVFRIIYIRCSLFLMSWFYKWNELMEGMLIRLRVSKIIVIKAHILTQEFHNEVSF